MRVLVVGAGGVGSAFVAIASKREVYTHITVADIDVSKAQAAVGTASGNDDGTRIVAAHIDASSEVSVADLARSMQADVVLNACDPRFNPPIFEGAFAAGCNYVDMAMNLSVPHATKPYEKTGIRLGDGQFAESPTWKARGMMALCGMGVEPGFSDVAARYAADELFSEIHEIGVRDGADLVVDGYDFAPTFSIWTTIEECLNPPVIYERERGWFTTEPFSEPEIFTFPEGIGPLQCVNVEHEEVILIPRFIDTQRVTFKYGLGEEFIDVLKTLRKLELHSTQAVDVKGVQVSPRDVIAAILPDPATLGDVMTGRTCAGTWVTGLGKDGQPREVYVYHVVDNVWSMREFGHQAVVWQTTVMPAVAIELIAKGIWHRPGVVGPEALPPMPFLDLLDEYGSEWEWADYKDRAPSDGQAPGSTTQRPRTWPSRMLGPRSSSWLSGTISVNESMTSAGRSRPSRAHACSRTRVGVITDSTPCRRTLRRMNGITVVGRSWPPARPQAATTPPYCICASTLASIVEPTVSTAAAHCSDSSGRAGSVISSRPRNAVAPSPARYSWVSGRPVTAVTSKPSRASNATATDPTPPAAPVTSARPWAGTTWASSIAITQSIAVRPAVPIDIAVSALMPFGRFTSHSERTRWRCVYPPQNRSPTPQPVEMTASPTA